ncbi:MAG: response regulator [Acidobacteriota bacterium]|nr:response regulator [Blastocatellia bacterium]MDW8411702.1 response regulator [Acidobacteriota bacterium]
MQTILVKVDEEALLESVREATAKFAVKLETLDELTVDAVLSISPMLIILKYPDEESYSFFKSAIEDEQLSRIPFMFIVPESEKWEEIEGFRLGYDTKVSKERPKLGIELRVQAILNKAEDTTAGHAKDVQLLVESIVSRKTRPEEAAGSSAAAGKPSKPRILIAEDDVMTRSVLEAALEQDYELLFAVNGQEALDIAVQERPDIIISDVMMPVMDGMELLKRMRSSSVSKTPFLFLTARGAVEDKIAGLEHGADEYLSKPFSVRELQLRVSKLVEKSNLRRGAAGVIQGQLSEVSLPDVLQIISNNQKTGELVIDSSKGVARIFLQSGQIVQATFGKFSGLKALFRILALDEGRFLFENKQLAVEVTVQDKIENLLLEGYRQMDEFKMLLARFEKGEETMLKPGTEKIVQSGLSTTDALVLIAVNKTAKIKTILDQVSKPDLEVMESIINLLEAKLLDIEVSG